jgi:hypothetical protein
MQTFPPAASDLIRGQFFHPKPSSLVLFRSVVPQACSRSREWAEVEERQIQARGVTDEVAFPHEGAC